MRSTFKTLFYINRQKAKTDGSCPVMGRITIDRKVSQYYTGEDINPELWDVKAGRVLVKGRDTKEKQLLKDINIRLNELEQHAQVAYKSIVDAIGYVSSEMVRNAVTGRAELSHLTTDHIITEKDGSKWLYINRQKTKAECRIKLLDIPLRIMEKYKGEGDGNKIFYVPHTCSLCRSLKIIEEMCQLDFHLTFYLSRHNQIYFLLKNRLLYS